MLRIYRKLSGRGLSRWFPRNFFAKRMIRNMKGDVTANVQGFKMIVPIETDHGMVLFTKGIYESAVTKYIKKYLKEGDTFVDVGACLGYYSLLASQIVGSKGRVLAFEPDKTNYDYLGKNIDLNECENMRILPLAVSDKKGRANLNLSNHIGCHSLLHSKLSGHGDKATIVNTIRVDHCIDRIDMIKIDVEGWEYYVLKSIESFLSYNEKRIIVFMEYCPSLLKENKKLWRNLLRFIDRFFLDIAVIDEKKKKLEFVTMPELGSINKRVNLILWT